MVSVGSASLQFIGIFLIFHLFLNTVPPPAINHPCTLQPLLSPVQESSKCVVVECEPLNPWHISTGVCLPRCQGIMQAQRWIPREHRPNESLRPLTPQGGCLPTPNTNTLVEALSPSDTLPAGGCTARALLLNLCCRQPFCHFIS